MKQQAPTFEQVYDEKGFAEGAFSGFIPYREKGKYYYQVKIKMVANKWSSGSYLHFYVYRMCDGLYEEIPRLSKTVYTNKYPTEREIEDWQQIVPNGNQSRMIAALASGDLRGRTAEDIAYELYIELFLLHPYSAVKEILPKVVEDIVSRRNNI